MLPVFGDGSTPSFSPCLLSNILVLASPLAQLQQPHPTSENHGVKEEISGFVVAFLTYTFVLTRLFTSLLTTTPRLFIYTSVHLCTSKPGRATSLHGKRFPFTSPEMDVSPLTNVKGFLSMYRKTLLQKQNHKCMERP